MCLFFTSFILKYSSKSLNKYNVYEKGLNLGYIIILKLSGLKQVFNNLCW